MESWMTSSLNFIPSNQKILSFSHSWPPSQQTGVDLNDVLQLTGVDLLLSRSWVAVYGWGLDPLEARLLQSLLFLKDE